LSAPSIEEFHQETLNLVNNIHFFDVLRSDRGISSNGLEARVPFLRKKYIEKYLSISKELRKPSGKFEKTEKYLLREAFKGTEYLPDNVLYRQKEAFSDGVSSQKRSWFSILQENIEKKYTNDEFKEKQKKYVHNIPPSKEALYYREIFEKYFGQRKDVVQVIPYFWLPKWNGNISEPSARVLKHYNT
jgi:asparagine synthase (glutamine-hydrolysing)